ncbi:BrnA antitoxin family protein [Rhizobium sp. NRK18]|uniref:BrnA antitoxin family protein n=1 Tax=Rhizobium sp. NRK18 TaxID=2964667 RepID=UPI0021C3DF3A|nr:BrnA antitoxin family protein [Rhizobium sp. NRK18]MCQ2005127.1 BrnA antitoxin family protein [Rhizobium sp. NRK18]
MTGKLKPLRPLSDDEEAEIQRAIALDPDAREATDEQLAKARPFSEVFPDLHESIQRSRGRPPVDNPRKHVSLRLDADVLDHFKATGKGWQTRINEALRKAAGL